jgi:uncharacterized protein (TIGR00661 family)
MARILYSLSGEGRGHAARVRTMVEALKHEHELILLAPDEAYEFLAPKYPCGTPNVFVRRIPGLRFHYTRGRLDLTRSVLAGGAFWWRLPRLVEELGRLIDEQYPALAITDFEPALARAAVQRGVPLVSLDHQHFLTACDLSALPLLLRGHAHVMGLVVRALALHPTTTIVSSFFAAPLRASPGRVVQVGPLLRPELRRLRPTRGCHLVSYLRKNTPPRVLEMLAACDREVHVYGLGERKPEGNLRFREIDEQTFAYDLAACAAVVGAAGNQTLGEALYFGKPILALPEPRHHEQLINSHYLRATQAGDWTLSEFAEPARLRAFLRHLDRFELSAARYQGQLDGTPAALAEIQRFLPQPTRWLQTQPRVHVA